jgi:hypothetical protein
MRLRSRGPKLAMEGILVRMNKGARTDSLLNVTDHLDRLKEVAVFKAAGISKALYMDDKETITDS